MTALILNGVMYHTDAKDSAIWRIGKLGYLAAILEHDGQWWLVCGGKNVPLGIDRDAAFATAARITGAKPA